MRLPSCFVSYFADVTPNTPTPSSEDKFYFTVRLSQLFKSMLLSYDHIRDTRFLRSRTSNILKEPSMKIKNLLLHYPKAAFLLLREPITEVSCNKLSDYPVCLTVLTRNPFSPKNSKMLFEFIPHYLSQTYWEPIQKSKMEHFAKISQQLKTINFFLENVSFRCLTGFWIRLREAYDEFPNSSISSIMSVRSPSYCKR